MPMVSVILKSGVDTQQTAALNEAGVFQSQLIRYKDRLIQAYGGWQSYSGFGGPLPSTTRDLHAWQATDLDKFLSAAGTASLTVILSSGFVQDATPVTLTTNPVPSFSISSGSQNVTVVDSNSGTVAGDVVYFNTQVAVGNMLLQGAYPVASVLSTGSYIIISSLAASTTVSSGGTLPVFHISSGSALVRVTLPNNGYQAVAGLFYNFIAPTTAGGLTIAGRYPVASIVDSTDFNIFNDIQATGTSTATMNSSLAQLVYYRNTGIQPAGSGFGSGGFGTGGFGTGATPTGGSGTPITATDWTQDNWGEILMACPDGGPLYVWSDAIGITKASVVSQAPFFNGGVFISMPQQIVVLWGSCQSTGAHDPLTVRWSDSTSYTNWAVTSQTTAGSFHIPTGSKIVGGMQCPTFGLISTDIDVWVMQYVGGDVIFNFTRVGTGCGWASRHACGVLGGAPYWCGTNNFFTLGPNGVVPLPCPVWDAIFQNLNTAQINKIACAVNSTFNEITWFYPSASATENDSYVKVHIEGQEYEWDYGNLTRTAWTDLSVLGNPIGTDTSGFIYQHELGQTITGAGLPSFRSGWWAISDGNELSFVDFVMPDFQWGTRSGAQNAQVNLIFYSLDYPGDTPKTYGPYTVTQATEYINTRIRGRLMSVLVQTNNTPSFWRLGRIRYRWAPAGRR